jgi:hypothetical protein
MNSGDVKRKLATILSADEKGCGRLISDDRVLMKHKLCFEVKGGMSCA